MTKSNIPLQNVFTESSRKAIEQADRILASSRQHKDAPTDMAAMAKEAVAAASSTSAPIPMTEESNNKLRNLDQQVKMLNDTITSQAAIIDKIIASQNEMIQELNDLKKKVARGVSSSEAKPQQASMPSTAPNSTSSSTPVATEPVRDDARQQQNGNGAGLDPANFSVEKTFYFGRK
jgi:uncharacterized coiled-coil protein SlyX